MTDSTQAARQQAFEAAMEEAMAMLEQGENMDRARFDELVAQLQMPVDEAPEVEEAEDPRKAKMRELLARAGELERSAAKGHGQMDEVNSLLTPLMGKSTQ